MHYIYFLKFSNGQTYTGLTENLKRRIAEHEAGKVLSTKNRRPLTFVGYEAYLLKTDAERRERYMKTTEGKRLFRQQYRDILNSLAEESHSLV